MKDWKLIAVIVGLAVFFVFGMLTQKSCQQTKTVTVRDTLKLAGDTVTLPGVIRTEYRTRVIHDGTTE